MITMTIGNKKKTHKKKHARSINPDTIKKSMSCSPFVEKTKIHTETCYTHETLKHIQYHYNNTHPNDKITTNSPVELWKELKTKITSCSNQPEDCWLKTIKDNNMRNKIDEILFAPDAPMEWKDNPNEWLSNHDISKVLKQYEKTYPEFKYFEPSPIDFDKKPKQKYGKCVSDELCQFKLEPLLRKGKRKIGFVFNLDKHTQDGSHWVSMFLDIDDHFIFFFDSTGDDIPDEISKLKDRIVEQASVIGIELHFLKNHPSSHQYQDTECGMYSLFFIITLLTNSLVEIDSLKKRRGPKKTKKRNYKMQFRKLQNQHVSIYKIENMPKIKLFRSDKRIPDEMMEKYRKRYFNIPV